MYTVYYSVWILCGQLDTLCTLAIYLMREVKFNTFTWVEVRVSCYYWTLSVLSTITEPYRNVYIWWNWTNLIQSVFFKKTTNIKFSHIFIQWFQSKFKDNFVSKKQFYFVQCVRFWVKHDRFILYKKQKLQNSSWICNILLETTNVE